jgi:Xaa-Pro aminopeptidase
MKKISHYFLSRILRLQEKLKNSELEGALIISIDNIFYFSGHLISEGYGPSLLFIPKTGEPVLVIPEGELCLNSTKMFPGEIIFFDAEYQYLNGSLSAADTFKINYLKKVKFPIGIELDSISCGILEILEIESNKQYKDITTDIYNMRMIKDQLEIGLIQNAVRISLIGQKAAKNNFYEGINEITLKALCQQAMETEAGSPISCKSDILFGENTALIGSPAGVAGSYTAKKGDNAIIDLLPRVNGYYGDVSRVLFLKPLPDSKKVFIKLLLDVKKEIEKVIKSGVETKAIDFIARSRISKEGLFPHHTGHGIGISSYELPLIVPASNNVLREGMIITIEPGIYFDNWGARIEDDYLITKDGFEKLSGSLEEIE